MAEILGIVAGATQLLDLSARLVLASSYLYTNLKNVPEEIEALKKNTQDFYDLLWMISSDLDGPLNSQPNSLHVTHRIVSIFNDAMKESEELAILLERLTEKSSSSAKRLWSSVAGLKEKTEIVDRGRRLESLKSSIQMWYHHQSNMRLRAVESQLSTITHSQLATQSNLSLLAQQSTRAIVINQSLAMKLQSYHHAGMDMAGFVTQHRRPTGRNRLCTCKPSITISHVSKWNLQLFLERKSTHSKGCSRHTDTTTWSFGLRALSPRIQAMLGLQLGYWSLCMVGKISPHYVVDPCQSPAFVAVWEAMDKVREFRISRRLTMVETTTATSNGLTVSIDQGSPLDLSYQRHIESICATLRLSLLQAFTAGTASPADRTPEGITVLSQFLDFTMHFISYQEALFDLLSSTVDILIPRDAGSDSYIQSTWITPMQVLLLPNRRTKASRIRLQQLRLDGILISHGVDEISDEFRRDLARSSLVGIFNKHPCLLENYGQNPVHLAILQRSESKLRDLLDQGKVDLKVDNPPLLTLAIKWPAGLHMLLDAGAELSDAIESAILQEQLQSISLLLDHGCPVFGPYYDLLYFAIYSRASPDVILLLIERLAGRRQELLQLALDHLPESVIETSWCNYDLHPRPLLDYNAIELYKRLKAHGVEVPEALWPGPCATIYHSPSVHNNSNLAMKLYELGFHDINKSDDHGTTPLISAINACGLGSDDCPRLIQWYLDLGVTLNSQPFFTHVLSHSTCFPMMMSAGVWISQKQKLYDMLGTFRQLVHGNTQTNDDCRCWCSTTGCTPIGVVLRKRTQPMIYGSRAFPLLRRRRWLYLLPRYSSLGLCLDQSCFTEICRLEIFDRLGMAHTCCDRLENYVKFFPNAGPEVYRYKQDQSLLEICPQNHFPMPSIERKELQEEDYILKGALDLYLELYVDLLKQHQGTFESFWISWWFAIDRLLPFEQPEESPIRAFAVKIFGFVPQGDGGSQKDLRPLHLPGFLQDGLSAKAHDITGYSPDITAITSIVHECVTLLDPRAIDTFLNQLEPVLLEKCVYQQSILKPMRGSEPGLFGLD